MGVSGAGTGRVRCQSRRTFSKSTSARCSGCPVARSICSTHVGSTRGMLCGCSCFCLAGPPFWHPSKAGRSTRLPWNTGGAGKHKVAHDLSRVVFNEVFPILAAALARHDRGRPTIPDAAWLEQIRQGSLILLYRLLFVLYAEDRDLLPDERGPYAAYCLTRIRREVADARAAGRTPSPRVAIYWARLRGIFAALAHGDDGLGIPPTMVACSRSPPRRFWNASNCPTMSLQRSCSRCPTWRPNAGQNSSTTVTSRSSSSAPFTNASWSSVCGLGMMARSWSTATTASATTAAATTRRRRWSRSSSSARSGQPWRIGRGRSKRRPTG